MRITKGTVSRIHFDLSQAKPLVLLLELGNGEDLFVPVFTDRAREQYGDILRITNPGDKVEISMTLGDELQSFKNTTLAHVPQYP